MLVGPRANEARCHRCALAARDRGNDVLDLGDDHVGRGDHDLLVFTEPFSTGTVGDEILEL